MTLDELETQLKVMLHAFRVGYKIDRLIKSITFQFVVNDFGLVVSGVVGGDCKLISSSVEQAFPNYRKIFILDTDNLLEAKDRVLWALMQGGYVSWLRDTYYRDFKNIITMQEFGKKIINQRLKIWAGKEKYKYLIEYNESALRQSATYMLSIDPSFYDYMPEEAE